MVQSVHVHVLEADPHHVALLDQTFFFFNCIRWRWLSYLTLVAAWTVACQGPLSMGFPRQAYWNRLPFPSPGDLPNPGIEPTYSALVLKVYLELISDNERLLHYKIIKNIKRLSGM